MSPQFPPLSAPLPRAANPGSGSPIPLQGGGTRLLAARVIITVAGVAGFLGLLIAAAYFRSAEQVLRISAFVWFFGFGALRVTYDLRASRASRRREAGLAERDRRASGGLI